ncbi:MAG: class I SAM-dependent methyltransferase [Candidatus Moranbacteria bacterium]|nr:class I SAM-dependent methyltransferase [Candidatus Moranbacteria bacterium]
MDNQQRQTLDFFNSYAGEWFKQGQGINVNEVNVIAQRNNYVLQVIEGRLATESFLDVGCGTGDLVRDVARRGIRSSGIDFAKEMISIAENNVDPEIRENISYVCDSVFNYQFQSASYDVVSLNGFIEYISFDEFKILMRRIFEGLKPNGSLIVGSRNRLFNIMSFNNFTAREIEHGDVESLLKEILFWTGAFRANEMFEIDVPDIQVSGWEHDDTGIKVRSRYQYTPVQLMRFLSEVGFTYQDIHPIHVHGISPSLQKLYPEIHANLSLMLQQNIVDKKKLLPYSSSFMLHFTKAK